MGSNSNAANWNYFIENGKLYCDNGMVDTFEVVCTVEQFLNLIDEEAC